jgi:hypothetical protein
LSAAACSRLRALAVGRPYLTTDETEAAEAVVYCPECEERELGVNLLDEGD